MHMQISTLGVRSIDTLNWFKLDVDQGNNLPDQIVVHEVFDQKARKLKKTFGRQ